ncbi:glycosyl transferase family 2, partial [Candidatus Cerribacteria bacterium 'Amazon FNV 2010 28 9']
MKKADSSYKTISILIPVYNEEKTILTLITTVQKSNTCGLKKEIIVVNDASKDNTGNVLKKIKGITV